MYRIIFSLLFVSTLGLGAEHFTLPENRPLKLPFSDAVRVGQQLYISGAIGVLPGSATLVKGGIESEAEQTMKNIGLVLKHFGLNHSDLVRCQVMLKDITEWKAFNKVYTKFFKAPFPARSAFAATGLALGAKVEVECIAEMR